MISRLHTGLEHFPGGASTVRQCRGPSPRIADLSTKRTKEVLENFVRGLGPDEGTWVVIVLFEERTNVFLESESTSMDSSLQLPAREYGEPRFDEVKPRGVGWREVKVEPRVLQ